MPEEIKTEAIIEQSIEQPNSVELSVSQKGTFSGKVKVYAQTIDEAYNKSVEVE